MELVIKAEIPDRWVNDFCSLLRYMQACGEIGHSSLVGFYADGDGDFRPKFRIERTNGKLAGYIRKKGIDKKNISDKPEIMFDAG